MNPEGFTYPSSLQDIDCPIERAVALIGNKWSILIVKELFESEGPVRFNELRERLHFISSRTLSAKLKQLVEFEIVNREVVSSSPVKVYYSLTEKGSDLADIFHIFAKWSEKWHPHSKKAVK